MPLCTIFELLFFGAGTTCISLILSNSKVFESCVSPVNVFIIETIGLILVSKAISNLRGKSFVPQKARRILTIVYYFMLCPSFIGLGCQGMLYQVLDIQAEANCAFMGSYSWALWIVVVSLMLYSVIIVSYFVNYIFVWRRFRDFFRRHNHDADEIRIFEEYINLGFNQLSLSELMDSQFFREDYTGLSYADLRKISKKKFSKAMKSRQEYDEACPICFQDFALKDELMILPVCDHAFHTKCVLDWFKMSTLCPMCRANVRQNIHGKLLTPLPMRADVFEPMEISPILHTELAIEEEFGRQ